MLVCGNILCGNIVSNEVLVQLCEIRFEIRCDAKELEALQKWKCTFEIVIILIIRIHQILKIKEKNVSKKKFPIQNLQKKQENQH